MPLYSSLSYNLEQDLDIETVKGIQFSILSSDEILRRSVCEITKTDTYSGNDPVVNGLFDIRMGALELNRLCGTCGQKTSMCPNHMGHIKLAIPCYNAMFFDVVKKLLKCICFNCSKLLVSHNTTVPYFKEELKRIMNIKDHQVRFEHYVKFIGNISKKFMNTCGFDGVPGCGQNPVSIVKVEKGRLLMDVTDTSSGEARHTVEIAERDVVIDNLRAMITQAGATDSELNVSEEE